MKAIIKTLRNGIVLRDARGYGAGVFIEKNNDSIKLVYSKETGFYLITKQRELTKTNYVKYMVELESMINAMNEANNYLSQNSTKK